MITFLQCWVTSAGGPLNIAATIRVLWCFIKYNTALLQCLCHLISSFPLESLAIVVIFTYILHSEIEGPCIQVKTFLWSRELRYLSLPWGHLGNALWWPLLVGCSRDKCWMGKRNTCRRWHCSKAQGICWHVLRCGYMQGSVFMLPGYLQAGWQSCITCWPWFAVSQHEAAPS